MDGKTQLAPFYSEGVEEQRAQFLILFDPFTDGIAANVISPDSDDDCEPDDEGPAPSQDQNGEEEKKSEEERMKKSLNELRKEHQSLKKSLEGFLLRVTALEANTSARKMVVECLQGVARVLEIIVKERPPAAVGETESHHTRGDTAVVWFSAFFCLFCVAYMCNFF